MTTSVTNKPTDIVREARKIAERSNEPMSIDEIRAKFQVEFPFQIKKVAKMGFYPDVPEIVPLGTITTVLSFNNREHNWYDIDFEDCRTPPDTKQWVLV